MYSGIVIINQATTQEFRLFLLRRGTISFKLNHFLSRCRTLWVKVLRRGKASVSHAVAENHRADADHGGTVFDGDGVVVGHADGEFGEVL